MATILDASLLRRDRPLVRSARHDRPGHLRLVAERGSAERHPTAPGPRANPRLGAAVCVGFCGIFWSAIAVTLALG